MWAVHHNTNLLSLSGEAWDDFCLLHRLQFAWVLRVSLHGFHEDNEATSDRERASWRKRRFANGCKRESNRGLGEHLAPTVLPSETAEGTEAPLLGKPTTCNILLLLILPMNVRKMQVA